MKWRWAILMYCSGKYLGRVRKATETFRMIDTAVEIRSLATGWTTEGSEFESR
jgi:hypothetical protein